MKPKRDIGDAVSDDEGEIRGLLAQMGYSLAELADLHVRLARILESGLNRVLVAVEGANVVGVASLVFSQSIEHPAPNCRLSAIVTDADRRRQGIATELLAASEEAAKRAGCFGLN